MTPTIPSIYRDLTSADIETFASMPQNPWLRQGEVRRVIRPEDPESRTRKFVEYDVFVMHRENGTVASKIYHNCVMANSLAGLADRSRVVLRRSDRPAGETGPGSKVLVLCINAEQSAAVILGGIRDSKDTDIGLIPPGAKDFADLTWTYNGTTFRVLDDGSSELTYGGATNPDGTPRSDVDSKTTGTKMSIARDGNWRVQTSKQSIEIDHRNGVIRVLGDQDITLHAKTIHVGDNATEKAILGDTLVSILEKILDQISAITHAVPGGTSSTPLNAAAFKSIKSTLKTALSKFVTIGSSS